MKNSQNPEKESPIFVGNGRQAPTKTEIINISLCVSDIPKEYIKENKNGKRYLKLKLVKKATADKFGYTHYLSIDTFEAKKTNEPPF